MRTVKYRVSLVTYIDILGFSELIETKKAGDISRIIRVVKEAVQPDRFKHNDDLIPDDEYVNFSDSSVISRPLDTPNLRPGLQLFSLLCHLVRAQANLIFEEGIFMRGSVTIGLAVRSWGQLFGPAIVRAYNLEKVAKNPRIIVDSNIFKVLDPMPNAWHNDKDTDKKELRKLMRKDEDGEYFVDYLRAVSEEFNDPAFYPVYVRRHSGLISERLKKYSKNDNVRSKYEWLEKYHNSTIEKLKTHVSGARHA
jgi:hypothetical protein